MKVIAVIADIIQSKNLVEREVFQDNLRKVLYNVTEKSKGLISPYTITLGDEFQAVYAVKSISIEDILKIICELYPVKVRFSLGSNELHTKLNSSAAIGMDGPAFHYARNGIENLKKYDFSLIQVFNSQMDDYEFINNSLMVVFSSMINWKKNTYFIFQQLFEGKKIREISTTMDISLRAIYKIINTNSLQFYVNYFKSLQKSLIEACLNEV